MRTPVCLVVLLLAGNCVAAVITNPVSVLSFGAVCNGVNNDGPAIQAAINAVMSNSPSGGYVTFPVGVCQCNAPLVMGPGVWLEGQGPDATILRPGTSVSSLLIITGGLSGVLSMQLANQNSYGVNAITVSKPYDNASVTIRGNFLIYWSRAVNWTNGDVAVIEKNYFKKNDCHIYCQQLINGLISDNYFLRGNGVTLDVGPKLDNEGVTIDDNIILAAATTNGVLCSGIMVNQAMEVHISNNIIDQTGRDGLSMDATRGSVLFVKSSHNWYGPYGTNGQFGIVGTAGVRQFESDHDTFSGWPIAGIYSFGFTNAPNVEWRIDSPFFNYTAPNYRDIQVDCSVDVVISAPVFSSPSANLIINNANFPAGPTSGRVDGGRWTKLPNIAPGSAFLIGRQSTGLATVNSGTATIPSGNTSVAVTHGLWNAPSPADIAVTPTDKPTNMPGLLWVSSINQTQFTVNCANNPGTGGLSFAWKADISR
jgi:Pectate lyase superfamily protein